MSIEFGWETRKGADAPPQGDAYLRADAMLS